MASKTDPDVILDRIEEAREGEFLTDIDVKEYLMGEEGILTQGRIELGDKLFQEHMRRFDKRVEEKIEDKMTIEVSGYDEHPQYRRGYKRWNDDQEMFIKQRIGVKSVKQIVYEYNSQYLQSGQERSESSIRTKVYRMAK